MDRAGEILDFWFEGVTDSTVIDRRQSPFHKWFDKNERFDEEIRLNFEGDFLQAREGGLAVWEKSPEGTLALILCFDQFTRNMFRNSPQMFSADPLALALSAHAVKTGLDSQLKLIERLFVYMPFMHAEDRTMQETSVKFFESLAETCAQSSPGNAAYYHNTLSFARRHKDIVERFGRFPHRNRILGRSSTLDEVEFLAKPGSAF